MSVGCPVPVAQPEEDARIPGAAAAPGDEPHVLTSRGRPRIISVEADDLPPLAGRIRLGGLVTRDGGEKSGISDICADTHRRYGTG